MCTKSAPYLHNKSANLAFDMLLFDALVLMLFTNFVKNSIVSRIVFDYDGKFAPNILLICPKKTKSAFSARMQKSGTNKVP